MYFGTEYSLKSGNCKIKKQFNLDPTIQEKVELAMQEIGVDVCHVEGLFKDDKVYIFDINPYPTASGNTLSAITEELSLIVINKIKEA
jgi:predicted ATP-grasp superfamily ATP-dependent carboligase